MNKEYYFKKAEEVIESAKLSELLVDNRTAFGQIGECKVKVFLQPLNRKQYLKQWKNAQKKLPELKEEKWVNGFEGERVQPFYIHGYMILDIEK